MNLVALILTILLTLTGINTAVIKRSDDQPISLQLTNENAKAEVEHPSIKARKGVVDQSVTHSSTESKTNVSTSVENTSSTAETRKDNVAAEKPSENGHVHQNNVDRVSSTLPKGKSTGQQNGSSEGSVNSSKVTHETDNTGTGSSNDSVKYSSNDSNSKKTDTSSSIQTQSNSSNLSNSSKSTSTNSASTESKSSSKSSSINKKPLITYSVEDDPTLLNNKPGVREHFLPLTPIDMKFEADNAAYLPPSSDFVLDRSQMQSKREMYIFPLVVLIFLVPMILGVGIIIVRRVRDYWSTRHYRRMDFLVDGMYNS